MGEVDLELNLDLDHGWDLRNIGRVREVLEENTLIWKRIWVGIGRIS